MVKLVTYVVRIGNFRCWELSVIWSVIIHGECYIRTLRKNGETYFDAFEMKGLRKILRVSWTAKKTNGFLTKLQ